MNKPIQVHEITSTTKISVFKIFYDLITQKNLYLRFIQTEFKN